MLVGLYGWIGAIVLVLPAVSWLLESHADMSAADVCGDPRALASALKKLPHSSYLSLLLYLPFHSHPPMKLRVWRLNWTLRISSGVSEGVYKSVEQSDREFLNIGVGDRQ